jgi:hypothetical protein
MIGRCKYCGFIGTNDEMEEHAGECPEMLRDYQPDEPGILKKIFSLIFRPKYRIPKLMLVILSIYAIVIVALKFRSSKK